MRHRSNPLLRLVPFLWTALAATAPVAPAQEAPRTASNGWHAHLAGRGLLLLPAAAPAGRSPWCPGLAFYDLCTGELEKLPAVSRAFPSCTRSILTEIYLCHACSCHEIEDANAWTG